MMWSGGESVNWRVPCGVVVACRTSVLSKASKNQCGMRECCLGGGRWAGRAEEGTGSDEGTGMGPRNPCRVACLCPAPRRLRARPHAPAPSSCLYACVSSAVAAVSSCPRALVPLATLGFIQGE